MLKKQWRLKTENKIEIDILAKKFNLNPLVINCLYNRGIETEEEIKGFLAPVLSGLHDPFLINDMDLAVNRIKKAIKDNERIVVYGDYDVDGITSVSILYLYLRESGANISYYIPDRMDEGYGINKDALIKLKNLKKADLLITVDCGITAVSEIQYAKDIGLDVIITDHHKCPQRLPEAIAVINPKREDSNYPFPDLAGVGVTFKLIQALEGNENTEKLIDRFSSIVALGTIADIVPLTNENRILAYYGLKNIKNTNILGLKTLIEVSELSKKDINSGTLGYQIAPRINAVGRMDNASIAVELFTSNDENKVLEISKFLNDQNIYRQEVEQTILSEVKEYIEKNKKVKNSEVIVIAKAGWHSGVIGIVASRITEEYYKPCVLITLEEGVGKGSCRSIKGFNIYAALSSCEDILQKFGGHELASGLTISENKIDELRDRVCDYYRGSVKSSALLPEVSLDGEITETDMNEKLVNDLSLLEPFGMGNPQPNFLIKKTKLIKHMTFKDGKHLKLSLKQKDKYIDAVGFSMGEYINIFKAGDFVSIAGNVYINEFRGEKYFSIRIKDIRLA